MRIEIREMDHNTVIVRIEGDVDMSTSPEVRKALSSLFEGGVKRVIIDLSSVSYMDSSGIATLIEGLQRSRELFIRFSLAGLSASVEAAFELAHLKEVFDIHPDLQRALSGG